MFSHTHCLSARMRCWALAGLTKRRPSTAPSRPLGSSRPCRCRPGRGPAAATGTSGCEMFLPKISRAAHSQIQTRAPCKSSDNPRCAMATCHAPWKVWWGCAHRLARADRRQVALPVALPWAAFAVRAVRRVGARCTPIPDVRKTWAA